MADTGKIAVAVINRNREFRLTVHKRSFPSPVAGVAHLFGALTLLCSFGLVDEVFNPVHLPWTQHRIPELPALPPALQLSTMSESRDPAAWTRQVGEVQFLCNRQMDHRGVDLSKILSLSKAGVVAAVKTR